MVEDPSFSKPLHVSFENVESCRKQKNLAENKVNVAINEILGKLISLRKTVNKSQKRNFRYAYTSKRYLAYTSALKLKALGSQQMIAARRQATRDANTKIATCVDYSLAELDVKVDDSDAWQNDE
tara:strand:+ start:226 stop:600 length:375 start_codon:yes stop_codon:yes gene_type:complete